MNEKELKNLLEEYIEENKFQEMDKHIIFNTILKWNKHELYDQYDHYVAMDWLDVDDLDLDTFTVAIDKELFMDILKEQLSNIISSYKEIQKLELFKLLLEAHKNK